MGHFYLDGALVGFLSGGFSTIYESSAAFILGALGNPTSHYDGLMDEVAIYNRTLEYGEILDLYNEGSAIPYSGGEMMMMRMAGGGSADVSSKQKVQKDKDWVDGNSIDSPDYYTFTATSTPETKKLLEKYLKHLKDTNNNDKNKDNTRSGTTTQDTKDVVEEGSNEESITPPQEVPVEVISGEGSKKPPEEVVEEVLEEGSPQSPEILEDVAEENTKPPEKALKDVLEEKSKKPLKKIDEEVPLATSTLGFFPSLEMWALNTHSLLLDGNNDYTYITDAGQTGLDLSGDLTIEFWVKPTSLPGDAFIVSKDDVSLVKQAYWVALDSSGKVFGRFSDDGSDYGGHRVNFTTNNVISTGSWQHVAAVYDISEDTALVYVNGSPVTTTNASSMGSSIYNSDVQFVHGARTFNNEMTSFFNGLVEKMGISPIKC